MPILIEFGYRNSFRHFLHTDLTEPKNWPVDHVVFFPAANTFEPQPGKNVGEKA